MGWVRWSAASAAGVAGFLWCPPAPVRYWGCAPPALRGPPWGASLPPSGRFPAGRAPPPLAWLSPGPWPPFVVRRWPLAPSPGGCCAGCCLAARSAFPFPLCCPPWPCSARGQRRLTPTRAPGGAPPKQPSGPHWVVFQYLPLVDLVRFGRVSPECLVAAAWLRAWCGAVPLVRAPGLAHWGPAMMPLSEQMGSGGGARPRPRPLRPWWAFGWLGSGRYAMVAFVPCVSPRTSVLENH